MAKSSGSSEAVINALLAERNQFQTWLNRLDSAADTTPEAVRGKVRSDYQARLDAVLARLTEHADGVREQLDQKKGRKEELLADESRAKETLAEAELRHTVGEYDEGEWTKVRAECNKALVTAREELAKVLEDIERLAEVAKLIAAPTPAPAAAPEPPKAQAPAPAAPEPAAAEPPRRDSGRAEFVPSAKAKPPADELEFLRATVGEAETPAPKRATTAAPSAKPEPEAKPAAKEKKGKSAPAEPAPEAAEGELPKPRATGENRTLKCPDCGTMNRATEWYCERCGSELAGV
ncbi:MAG TPA: Ran-binding zinc finger domain-containing protein [Gemmatimonadales bacterium]|nr:Ran-binding zinc finger domain-containing protein [Gemmatimonadales bacterium]